MKILHVISHFGIRSGAARLVASLIPYQIESGHEVGIVSLSNILPSYADAMEKIGCHFYALLNEGKVPKHNPKLIFKLMPFIKSYDVVHVHLFPALYLVVAAKMLTHAKCALVVTEHSTLNNRQGKAWIKPFERFIYHRYDAIISITDAVKNNLHRFVDSQLLVETIANGIDIISIRNANPVPRMSLGIPDNTFLVIQVAGFRPEKDQLTLIKALKRLPNYYHVMFVGEGATLPEHQQKVTEWGLINRVHFLGLRQDVPALLKTADLVVMSSHYEGFGLAAVEGMAAGKPVIASDVSGLKEVVQGAGILFPVHDDRILADEIFRLLENKDYQERVIKACSERVLKYDIRTMASKYNEVYKRIIL